jgi:hypothetical protein
VYFLGVSAVCVVMSISLSRGWACENELLFIFMGSFEGMEI